MSSLSTIRLETTSPCGLQGATWTFYLLGDKLVVDGYSSWSKESKRHKPKVIKTWSRLVSRESNIKQADIPFTPVIAAAAKHEWLQALAAKVSVGFQGA